MRTRHLFTLATLAAAIHSTTAAEIWQGDNRFSLNAAVGYNIKLSSRNIQPPPPNPGPATGPQVDRFYDNGFVRVDVSDNEGGQTTFWGFDTAQGATYDGLPGGAVTLSSTRSPAQGETFQSKDEPQLGMELGYARRLFRLGEEQRPWLLVGVEAGFVWLDLAIKDTSGVTGNAVTTDTFFLAPGHVVLGTSYQGNFLGDPPGPMLGSEPIARDFSSGTATLANQLSGDLFGFKLGPTFEVPVSPSLLLSVCGGWTVTGVRADYAYLETTTVGPAAPSMASGTGRFDSWRGGWYVRGALAVDLGRQWQAQAGVQWQDTSAMNESVGDYEARLDLGKTVLLTLGLGYSF